MFIKCTFRLSSRQLSSANTKCRHVLLLLLAAVSDLINMRVMVARALQAAKQAAEQR